MNNLETGHKISWLTRARWRWEDLSNTSVVGWILVFSPVLTFLAAIGALLLAIHWGHCLFAKTEIELVEDTTREIYFVERHWFSKTEYIKLEARRDENGDWKWMAKSPKTGDWYSFFRAPID